MNIANKVKYASGKCGLHQNFQRTYTGGPILPSLHPAGI